LNPDHIWFDLLVLMNRMYFEFSVFVFDFDFVEDDY